ncbi:MAG: hypothetical protein AAFX05_09755 [Planctomycetota bacterium]
MPNTEDQRPDLLAQIQARHCNTLALLAAAIDLGHIAAARLNADEAARIVGFKHITALRSQTNDLVYRYARSLCSPVEGHLIDCIRERNGHPAVFLLDGLPLRLKKADAQGRTSNYPTRAVRAMGAVSFRYSLFAEQDDLDIAIEEGLVVDLVYFSGEAAGQYNGVGLKLAGGGVDCIAIDIPTDDVLVRISPEVHETYHALRADIA